MQSKDCTTASAAANVRRDTFVCPGVNKVRQSPFRRVLGVLWRVSTPSKMTHERGCALPWKGNDGTAGHGR